MSEGGNEDQKTRDFLWRMMAREDFKDVHDACVEVLGVAPTDSQLKRLFFMLPGDTIRVAVEWGVAVDTRFRESVYAYVRDNAASIQEVLGIKLGDEITRKIAEAYRRDLAKPQLQAFKEFSRYGRKYGFPVVCTLQSKSELEQLHWAASILLEVAGTWPRADVPELLALEPHTALFNDARQLLANGLGNHEQISKLSGTDQ